jgi:hypothetical protein
MSTVKIKLLGLVEITKPNASKQYLQMVVTHQEVGKDKPDGKKIFDFNTPKEVWNTLKTATPGQYFEVDRQKDAKEGKYWEWKAIRATDGAAAITSAPTPTATVPVSTTPSAPTARVGNWETPEERAAKQVYIVRQSSLTAAIAYLNSVNSDTHTEEDVIQYAKRFENYVLGSGVAGLTNDIPE